jgi:hypothetical protein
MCRLSWNLRASTSWNSVGLSRPVMGFLYLCVFSCSTAYFCSWIKSAVDPLTSYGKNCCARWSRTLKHMYSLSTLRQVKNWFIDEKSVDREYSYIVVRQTPLKSRTVLYRLNYPRWWFSVRCFTLLRGVFVRTWLKELSNRGLSHATLSDCQSSRASLPRVLRHMPFALLPLSTVTHVIFLPGSSS